MSLTGAELRLLPYLATHLTFPEIAAGSSSRATPSRPKRFRSIASWARRRAARRSSVPSRSGSWTARSTLRKRISPRKGEARAAPQRFEYDRPTWTTTRSTCVASPFTTMRSSSRSWEASARQRLGPRHEDRGTRSRCRDGRRRRGAFLVPARRGTRPRGRGDKRRDRRHARGRDAGDGRCRESCRPPRSSRSRSATTSRRRSSSTTPDEPRNSCHQDDEGRGRHTHSRSLVLESLDI